ncbi:hypothetical protein cypCar_00021452 [Cyprinus carpio]|nr:hypothetical protein cypCar_00021452 [Cyprinus carpio]
MSVASSSGGRQVSQQVFLRDERAARDQIPPDREVISSYENHHNETEEEEYYPRLSTKELAQHFEKTIEEAAPSKKIKDDSDNEEDSKKIIQQEIIPGGDVKNRALMFEMQPVDTLGMQCDSTKQNYVVNEMGKRDEHAAAWLFETKPMDMLNKIHTDDEQTEEVIFTQEAPEGDVKSVRYMFENQEMNFLGDTETMAEKQLLNLKSVLEEIKSEVKKVIWMFEMQCLCVLREHSGEMVLITSVPREETETEKGDVKTSRLLFETQPLDDI